MKNDTVLLEQIVTPEKHSFIRKKENLKGTIWKLQADAVVIGSGAGGSVAAAELSAHGWKVILIEEGSFFNSENFPEDEFHALSSMYRDGGVIFEEKGQASILQGRTLGGSTTINWQASLYPEDHVTNEWREKFGLSGFTQKENALFIKQVHERLNVHTVPESLRNENNNILFRGSQSLSVKPESLKNNSKGCIGLGRCGLGCPINAKQSTFLTYIPDAISKGATIITNMRATEIVDGKTKKVKAEFSPHRFKKTPSDIFEKLEISAQVVIVSAGAIESPALLLRSNLGNGLVGRHLKLHPTQTIFARFTREVKMYEGVPQSIVVKSPLPGINGHNFWIEAAPYRLSLATSLIPFFGKAQFETLKNYKNLQAGIVLARDGADGPVDSSVEWKFGRRRVHYQLSRSDAQNMLLGLKTLAEVQTAAGATELVFPFRRFTRPVSVKRGDDFSWILSESPDTFFAVGSAHPHGSIQASDDMAKGAIDGNFELYGHKNIFVMDASVFPTALGVNPQITTMSVIMNRARALASLNHRDSKKL